MPIFSVAVVDLVAGQPQPVLRQDGLQLLCDVVLPYNHLEAHLAQWVSFEFFNHLKVGFWEPLPHSFVIHAVGGGEDVPGGHQRAPAHSPVGRFVVPPVVSKQHHPGVAVLLVQKISFNKKGEIFMYKKFQPRYKSRL